MMQNQRQTRARTTATAKLAAHDENAQPKTRAAIKGKAGVVGKELASKATLAKKATATTAVPRRAALGEVASNQAATAAKEAKESKLPAKRPVRAAAQKKTTSALEVVQEETAVVQKTDVHKVVKTTKVAEAKHKDSRKENNAEPAAGVLTKHVMNDANEELPVAKKAKTAAAKAPTWEDLDADDENDPMMVSEYVVEIFDYMKDAELDTMPDPNYMVNQTELQWRMRSILIDWLIEVHNKFRLLPETLYLAVNIIDRFLTKRSVSLVKLQLVGVTAMFIAAKYEEVIAPSIQNFIYMADGGYADEEVLKAERYVLQILDFRLHYPSPMSFLRRCSKADNYDIQSRTVAKYLMEISLVDNRFLSVRPSLVAAAGMYLARRMLGKDEWDANLVHYSGYTEGEITPVSDTMIDFLRTNTKYEALSKKYSSRKFMKASIYVQDWINRNYSQAQIPRHPEPAVEDDDDL